MRALLLLCFSTYLLLPAPARAQAPAINPDTAARRLGAQFVGPGGHVGLSIGIIDHGRTYFYNFGTTALGGSQAPTGNTLYEIGSITKTFTSLLLAQAVTEKKLALNDGISQYLDGQYPNLSYQGRPSRLLHLANTTSGLPDNLPDRPELFQRQRSPDSLTAAFYGLHRNYSRAQFYQDLHRVTLSRAPGTRSQHSNTASQLLGYILERVYQQSYEQLVQRYILGPAGMGSTFPATAIPAAGAPRQATGYSRENHAVPYLTLPDLLPAGGLNSTATDLVQYLQLQLAEQSPAVQLTHRVSFGRPAEEAVGLSWFVRQTTDSRLAYAHSGGSFGFASYCVFYPGQGRGMVLLANKNTGSTESRLAALAAALEEGIYGTPAGLKALRAALAKSKYQNTLSTYTATRRQHPELFLAEGYVNSWGSEMLGKEQKQEAIGVFELNVGLYPQSANAYDSLGEAYEASGSREQAIRNFRRSLQLNPANSNAVEHLKGLGAAP